MNKLPNKVISRLTLYHCILVDYIERDITFVSSLKLSKLLNIDDSQIRKDIKLLDYKGKCKVGYSVKELKEVIEHRLTFKRSKDVFIVGAGNLGLALAKNDNFDYYGFNILALFDSNDLKTGISIDSKEIFHISRLPDLTTRLGVEIAILTVPRSQAQKVADLLIDSGIKYIWNFTQCILDVPENIHVWNENLIGHFLQLTIENDSVINNTELKDIRTEDAMVKI